MSFSFSVENDTQVGAISDVEAAMDKVAADQPIHTKDRNAVVEAAKNAINVLQPGGDFTKVILSVSGSLSTRAPAGEGDPRPVNSATVSISAYLEQVPKAAQQTAAA